MTYPIVTDLTYHSFYIFPTSGSTHLQQLEDCFRQYQLHLQDKGYSRSLMLKQTIFVDVKSNREYGQIKEILLACTKKSFEKMPVTSVLAQAPENGLVA